VISLGETPLANALLTKNELDAVEPRFPLDLVFCQECALVQITETVTPDTLFRDYPYFSSFSDTMLMHAQALVTRLIGERGLDARSQIIEIASNDGYLLQYYKARGIPVLGIEPAANVAAVAERERGIETLVEFFGSALGERLGQEGRRADVVHAHNVFAHVPDPGDFTRGLKQVLKPAGVAIIEAPYVKDLISGNEFDTIYHEHFSYYSLTAVEQLMRCHGLAVVDVEHVPIHGGSLRYVIGHSEQIPSPRVPELLTRERSWGVNAFTFYEDFAERVWRLRDRLLSLLHQLKVDGKRLAAYGASAKGSTLLNAFGIGSDLIDFVADRSTAKQGRYTPGTRLEVLAPDALMARFPDYVLLLTWNFAEEILEQQRPYRQAGGRFIIPIPDLRVL
jgi:SAM-dependent methyltransferase